MPTLTVADNLLLGIEPRSPRELHHQARALLDACEIPDVSPGWRVEDLTLPERQMVEIAKAVRHEPRLLFLDESTSALGEGASKWFAALLSRLRDRGTTLVFITHRLGEIREHCDHATVLRNGEAVGDVAIDQADEDEVVRMMIGRSMDQAFPDRRPPGERPVKLATRGLCLDGAFQDVDLELREGEILGVAGLDGQGQRELFLSLFGCCPQTAARSSSTTTPCRSIPRAPPSTRTWAFPLSPRIVRPRACSSACRPPRTWRSPRWAIWPATAGSTNVTCAGGRSRRPSGSTSTRGSSTARSDSCRAATSRRS